jgi:hypothetical protein
MGYISPCFQNKVFSAKASLPINNQLGWVDGYPSLHVKVSEYANQAVFL